MARVSIYYDKDLKEQFFMVRGDEGYARSTKIFLEQGATSADTYDFSVVLNVDVLRDTGDSAIMFYDNDEPIGFIENWTSTNNGGSITIEQLTYGVDHNFTAKYMGNNKCSPSSSNMVTVRLEDTGKYNATLSFSSGTQFNPNTEFTKTITLSNGTNPEYNHAQSIDIYYDNEFVQTVTTNEGVANVTIPNTGDNGLHTLRAEYGGSTNLYPKVISMNISVGYLVELVEYPSFNLYGDIYDYSVKVTDYLNNPATASVKIWGFNGTFDVSDSNNIALNTNTTTDSNGMVHIQSGALNKNKIIAHATYNSNSYLSNEVEIKGVQPTSMEVTASPNMLFKDENTVLSFQTNSRVEGTPIVLTGDYEGTIYTNENGLATAIMTGNGLRDKIVTAQYGMTNPTKNVYLTDYYQYWEPKNNHNRIYIGSFYDLNNLFRITSSGNASLALYVPKNIDYELIMSGFSTSKSAKLNFMAGMIMDSNKDITVNNGILTNYGQQSHSNETWKVIRQNGTVSLYKGNTLMTTFANQEECSPYFTFGANYSQVTTAGVNYYTYASTNFDFTKLTIRGV